jgi:MerR HTH family regulatory protein
MKQVYTSKQFAEIVGVTLRQLQYWDERGILSAKRSWSSLVPNRGSIRLYSPTQVKRARILRAISASGRTFRPELLKLRFHKVLLLNRPRVVNGVLYIPVRADACKRGFFKS